MIIGPVLSPDFIKKPSSDQCDEIGAYLDESINGLQLIQALLKSSSDDPDKALTTLCTEVKDMIAKAESAKQILNRIRANSKTNGEVRYY